MQCMYARARAVSRVVTWSGCGMRLGRLGTRAEAAYYVSIFSVSSEREPAPTRSRRARTGNTVTPHTLTVSSIDWNDDAVPAAAGMHTATALSAQPRRRGFLRHRRGALVMHGQATHGAQSRAHTKYTILCRSGTRARELTAHASAGSLVVSWSQHERFTAHAGLRPIS